MRRYTKAFIEKNMKDWPGGTSLVLTAQFKNQPGKEHELVALGHKYNSHKCVCFVLTGGFSTRTVGRCRLPVSKLELKACLVSALETEM